MSRIIVEAASSDVAKSTVIDLLEGGFEAKSARIFYNLNKGLPLPEDTDNYPLILEGQIGFSSLSVHVYSVTAGYGGTGPHATVAILRTAGFNFEESDILTNKQADFTGQIDLPYTR